MSADDVLDQADRASREDLLLYIAEAVKRDGLPVPMTIDLVDFGSGRLHVQLRMDNNRADAVDEWTALVGAEGAAATPHSRVHTGAGGTRWFDYGYGRYGDVATWHGVRFEVWSAVDVDPEGSPS